MVGNAITARSADVNRAGALALLSENERRVESQLYSRLSLQLWGWLCVLARYMMRVVSTVNRLGGKIDTHRMETRNGSGIGIRRLGL